MLTANEGKTEVLENQLGSLPAGAMRWQGNLQEIIDLILERQMLDADWWQILESQFSQRLDGYNNGWRGEYWGKLMRGACLLYTATGDERLYRVLEQTVKGLLTHQDDLGRICTYIVEQEFAGWDMWCRKYVLLGCEYFLEICQDAELRAQVIEALKKHADYILAHIGEGEGKKSIFQTSNIWGCVNSSSILEPMVRLYTLTGEQRYLDFATYLVEAGGSADENIFETALKRERYPYQNKVTKAYEVMSCFEGLLEYYRVTGEEKWKTAVVNLVDQVAKTEITILGTGGCSHELFDHSAVEQFNAEKTGPMLETCVTVTWMKLCYRVMCLTGDCRYADYIERAFYNAMLGAVNTDNSPENGGLTFDSYSPLNHSTRGRGIGGLQTLNWLYFSSCCDSIGAAGVGIGALFAVMQDEAGTRINTYLPGQVRVPCGAGHIDLTIATAYPRAGAVDITVNTQAPMEHTIKLRIPSFSKQSQLTVNGQPVVCRAGEYAELTRTWQDGDSISLMLDMSPRMITPQAYGVTDSTLVAYEAGPLVLARDARFGEDLSAPIVATEPLCCEAEVPFRTQVCCTLPQPDGRTVHLADYASCGKTWNKKSLTTVWMQTTTE